MALKPVSAVAALDQRQRTLFVAEAMKRLSTKIPTARPDVLFSLLNDTQNLSEFVRYSTLPIDVKDELLLDISRHAAGKARLSDRSLTKISDVLGGTRPQAAGGDVTYQDNSATDVRSVKADVVADSSVAPVNFAVFRPSQTDFEKTIDNISLDAGPGDDARGSDHVFGVPPLIVSAQDPLHMSLTLLLAASTMIAVVVFGFWIF